jgi:type I restriction enzyme S subunit
MIQSENRLKAIIIREIEAVEEYKTILIAEAVLGKIDLRNFEISDIVEEESYEELEEELIIPEEDETEYETEDFE